jgi:hypothetical protein
MPLRQSVTQIIVSADIWPCRSTFLLPLTAESLMRRRADALGSRLNHNHQMTMAARVTAAA